MSEEELNSKTPLNLLEIMTLSREFTTFLRIRNVIPENKKVVWISLDLNEESLDQSCSLIKGQIEMEVTDEPDLEIYRKMIKGNE